jgi:hypothetical protein
VEDRPGLPQFDRRSRGSFRPQSLARPFPRTVMASVLPFCPWSSLSYRVFGLGRREKTRILILSPRLSVVLRHPSGFPHPLPLSSTSPADQEPCLKKAPCWSSSPPQHSTSSVALLFTRPFDPASLDSCLPWSREVPLSGFGYPLNGVSSPRPGGLFQPPTL